MLLAVSRFCLNGVEFWKRRAMSYEAPLVTYKHKVYAELLLRDSATGLVENFAWQASTVKPVNDAAYNQLAPMTVKSFG